MPGCTELSSGRPSGSTPRRSRQERPPSCATDRNGCRNRCRHKHILHYCNASNGWSHPIDVYCSTSQHQPAHISGSLLSAKAEPEAKGSARCSLSDGKLHFLSKILKSHTRTGILYYPIPGCGHCEHKCVRILRPFRTFCYRSVGRGGHHRPGCSRGSCCDGVAADHHWVLKL